MPFSTYAELQTSILSWLARPGDPLVSPAIADMITLFEREATRRLKVREAEKRASLVVLGPAVPLPNDFGEMRLATSGGANLTYVVPAQLPGESGPLRHYTIIGNEMRLGPAPAGAARIVIVYQTGVPPLSDTNTANWLLTQHPDCYLFGSLVEAELFIGSDDRVSLWEQRREAAFLSIETADRKARWPNALQIKVDGITAPAGGGADWEATAVPDDGTGVRTVAPLTGETVIMTDSDRALMVTTGPLAALTIWLPSALSVQTREEVVELGFARSVTALSIRDAGGAVIAGAPASAYGPGAAILMRYVVGPGWCYWK